MHNVFELNDIGVVELLEQRDFSDGCARNALVSVLESDLFDCDCCSGSFLNALMHNAVSTFP